MATSMDLIYKVLLPSISTFETPPRRARCWAGVRVWSIGGSPLGISMTSGDCWRTPKCRHVCIPPAFLAGTTAGENCRQIKYVSNLEGDSPTVTHEPGLSTAYENCGALFKS